MIVLLLLLFLPALASANSAADIPGAQNDTFFYRAKNGPARATLSVPEDPNGKLILYLHPTTGITDNCAPSLQPQNSYFNNDGMRWQLQELLNQGYSILQPDYLGLGTPGTHPFLNLPKNMPAISSALSEAFQREKRLSGQYLAIGYSQGAALALETARTSAQLPGILQGTVSIAPPAFIEAQIKATSLFDEPSTAPSLLIYLLRSSGNAQLLSPLARRVEALGKDMCVLELSSLAVRAGLSPKNTLVPGSWKSSIRQKFLASLKYSQPWGPLAGPTLIVSGDDDRTSFPSLIKILSNDLQRDGSEITTKEFAADHFSITSKSWPSIRNFVDRSFQSTPARFYLPIGTK